MMNYDTFFSNLLQTLYNNIWFLALVVVAYVIVKMVIASRSFKNNHSERTILTAHKVSNIVYVGLIVVWLLSAITYSLRMNVNVDTSIQTRYNVEQTEQVIKTTNNRANQEIIQFKRDPTNTR